MIIERELYPKIERLIKGREAIVILGMRRVGKTTLLKYIMERIESDNKVYIDLENPASRKIFDEEDYDRIYNNLLFYGIESGSQSYVFLDEIQLVKNIPQIIKYLIDHYRIKFFLTGSAGYYLRDLFSESLSGRKYIFELMPFSFSEFLKLKGAEMNTSLIGKSKVTEAIYEKIERYYEEYILYGGMPDVISKEHIEEKKGIINDIFTSYFNMEITRLGDFKKLDMIRDLIFLLISRTGSKLDINKISSELGVSRETVSNYISFLEKTFFIKLISPFTKNRDVEIKSQKKVYICDTGFINEFGRVSEGAVFENAVFLSIYRIGDVNYYQKKSGVEIDFILNKEIAYEVKITPTLSDLKRLDRLKKELRLKDYYIVSRRFSELDRVKYGFEL